MVRKVNTQQQLPNSTRRIIDLETFLFVSPDDILYYCGLSTYLWFLADDDNLIILDPIPGQEDCQSDYINACYVDVSVCASVL